MRTRGDGVEMDEEGVVADEVGLGYDNQVQSGGDDIGGWRLGFVARANDGPGGGDGLVHLIINVEVAEA